MRPLLLAILCTLALIVCSTRAQAEGAADAGKPAGGGGAQGDKPPPKGDEEPDPDEHIPMNFMVGIDVARLSKLEVGPGTFEADFLVSIHCKAPPCKPSLYLYNGEIKGKPELLVDDDLHIVYRVKAELTAYVELNEFPFDKHILTIELGDRDALDVKIEVD